MSKKEFKDKVSGLSPYQKRKASLMRYSERLDELDNRLTQALVDFKDSMKAQSVGLQNVYDKFIEIEKRQKAIEELLETDHLKNIVKLIPSQEDILRLFKKWATK